MILSKQLEDLLFICLNWAILTGKFDVEIMDVDALQNSFTLVGDMEEQMKFSSVVQHLYDSAKEKMIQTSIYR